jgi:phosphopantothenoylcysteine decarboxylase/phosphopantothenate--cysteine ligase
MKRLRFVVTAGPTREHIDPVRFLSNPSTGKMGFAIARAAARRGHDVTLVAGPVSLKTPKGASRVDVVSAREMLAAVERALSSVSTKHQRRRRASTSAAGAQAPSTVFISTAAVADWRPAKCATRKLKKGQMSDTLKLVRNPDILKEIGRRRVGAMLVGFAAETDDVLAEARRKCREKGLEMIVANDVTEKGSGFGTDTNRVTFMKKDGTVERLPLMSKLAVATRIVREVERLSKVESFGT